ncbi:hypothetical protein [Paraburkholderia sp. GAS41]|uniref:hypothetical protein n=1 Tax=Paraburkholderia sp. GAS41 TaxID=3035134 RepID=UPI003D200518
MKTKLAQAYLSNHSMKRLLERCGVLSNETVSIDHVTGKLVYLNPLQSSALLMALFDGWTDVESAVEEANADDTQFRPLKRKRGRLRLEPELLTYKSRNHRRFFERNRESLIARAQLKYIAIRENMPHLNHRGIRKELGWLGRYATVESLKAAGESAPTITFDADRNRVIDQLLSIRRRISC